MLIKLKYEFYSKYIPKNLTLALEDEYVDEISVNNNFIELKSNQYFVDKSINEYPISDFAFEGKNEIIISYTISPNSNKKLTIMYLKQKKIDFFTILNRRIYI